MNVNGDNIKDMAAVTASHPSQDVGFQNFVQQEESSVEDIEDNDKSSEHVKHQSETDIDSEPVKHIPETDKDEHDGNNEEESKPRPESAGGGKFQLGIDDGAEYMDELAFTLQQHCVVPAEHGEGGPGASGHGQPPPGHWVSQPHGECY